MRLTKHRVEILNYLKTATSSALSAAAIHEALPHIDQVTIYRNLDLFVSTSLIKKLHLTAQEAVYEYQSHPHQHAICDTCTKVIHFAASQETLKQQLSVPDFTINHIDVVVRGTCTHTHNTPESNRPGVASHLH